MLARITRHNITCWIVAGSGFSDAINAMALPVLDEVPYADIPGMPPTTVRGHGASLRVVAYNGRNVGVFLGRHHLYEGHDSTATCSLVRTAQACGGTHVILTNASGGVHHSLSAGDIVLLSDGIDFTFQREGIDSAFQRTGRGGRLFDEDWTSRCGRQCLATGVAVRSGVYAQVTGPSYETRGEIRMLRRMGADLVGMSTVQEAAYGTRAGMHVLGVSLVTNKASDTTGAALTHVEVLDTATSNVSRLTTVLLAGIDCV